MGNSKDHAILSPSSSSRWLACTPSARLEEQFPSADTLATIEGTRAHKWAEHKLCLSQGLEAPAEDELYREDSDMEHYAEGNIEKISDKTGGYERK